MRKLIMALAALMVLLAACHTTDTPSTRQSDQELQNRNLARLSKELPVPEMHYAPTRRTVIEWIKRWDQPDKVSYIYLLADNGQALGYYVWLGLPVSYCVGITAPDQVVHDGYTDGGQTLIVQAPGLDGVYYSGGDCNHYYGFDAGSGAYEEFGGGVRFVAADQPLPIEAEPLGITTKEQATAVGFEPAEVDGK